MQFVVAHAPCFLAVFNTMSPGYIGKKQTRLYMTWAGMKQRCSNPKHKAFKRYGGRGITVCERWANSFEAFMEDMGPQPLEYTIERINLNGNYESTNCKWIPKSEQGLNQSRNHWLDVNGEKYLITHLARKLGIPLGNMQQRVKKGLRGDALIQPQKHRRMFEFGGEKATITQHARNRGVNISTVRIRMRLGWPMEHWFDPPVKMARHGIMF